MNREHLVVIIALMYKEALKLSQINFHDPDMNNLRDDLVKFATSIHSLPQKTIDTGNREMIAADAETITTWIHALMNSQGSSANKEIEFVIRLMAAHWGIGYDKNVIIFSHGDFAVTHFNKINSDPLSINVLENRCGLRFTKEPRIVLFPQLCDGDFLFTSILFHEVGHMVERDYGIAEYLYPFIENQLKTKPSGKVINGYFKTFKDNKTTTSDNIKKHIKEYVADVFGCQYVGTHILEYVKYRESQGRNIDRNDHPTFACREKLVQSMVDYMKSPSHSTSDQFLGKIIEVFHNLDGIEDLCQHYMLHPETNLLQGQPVKVNTEEELFSLFYLGWNVAIKGIHNLEQQKGVAAGSMTYNDYYTHINEVLRQSISDYMTTH